MPHSTTFVAHPRQTMGARKWLALGIGLTTLGVTVGLMLDDIHHGATWTMEHAFGLALLFLVPAAGLAGRWALAHGERGAGIAFIAAAVLGSTILVYLSTGRQADTRAESVAQAVGANGARASLEADKKQLEDKIASIQADLARFHGVRSTAEIKGAMDAVVGAGPGKVAATIWRRTNACASTEVTKADSAEACRPVFDLRIENGKALEREHTQRRLDAAEAERRGIAANLLAAGGERVVPSKARAFAEFVSLFGLDAARVEHVANRVDLVIRTLFLEGLTVVALEYALAGIGRPAPTQTPAIYVHAKTPAPTPPNGGKKRRTVRKDDARGDVLTFLRPVAQADLAGRWHVTKPMVSMWLAEWETEGIVQRTRSGRTATVQAASQLRAVA